MPIALVQTKQGDGGGYTNTNVQAFGSNVTAGNLIVLSITASATTNTIDSLVDSLGNTYILIDEEDGGDRTTWLYYAKNIAGGANTITVTYGTGQYTDSIIIAREYSGLDITTPLDVSKSDNSTTNYVNSHSTGASTATTQADELVVVAVGSSGGSSPVFTAGSGYGNLATQSGSSSGIYAGMMDKVVSATGAQTGIFDSTGYVRSQTLLATFKQASTPATNTGRFFAMF